MLGRQREHNKRAPGRRTSPNLLSEKVVSDRDARQYIRATVATFSENSFRHYIN